MVGEGDGEDDFSRDFSRGFARDFVRDVERDVVRGAVVDGDFDSDDSVEGGSSVVGGGLGTAIVGTDGVEVDDASDVSLDIQSSHSLVASVEVGALGVDVVAINVQMCTIRQ